MGLISVIIPVFNVRPYISGALESVTGQTYRNLEIIVIDDGSTDGSGAVCDEFAKRDERIKVIHQENHGLSNARNTGLDMMKGEAAAFLDPDDSYHPDYIKTLVEAMVRMDSDIAVCRYIVVHHTDKPYGRIRKEAARPSIKKGIYSSTEALQALADGSINISVWNKLYRSRLWDNIRFPDGHNYEDRNTTFRLFEICRSVFVLDQPLYYYLNHPGSITETMSEANIRDIILSRSHFAELIKTGTPAVFSFEQLNRIRQDNFNMLLRIYVRCVGNSSLSSTFLDNLREEIIRRGNDPGIRAMGLRGKTAYNMMVRFPYLLKISYPAYHVFRMLVFRTTGR